MDTDEYLNVFQLEDIQRKILDAERYLEQIELRREIKEKLAIAKQKLQNMEDACDLYRESVYHLEDKIFLQEEKEFHRQEAKFNRGK